MADTFRALRSRNYRLFFIGQTLSLIGTWMQTVAMSWLVYRITGSKVMLGTVALSSQIPMFFAAPFAGVITDRLDRKKILLVTQSLALLQAAVLSALVLCGVIVPWHIIVLSVFIGLINAFDMPTRQAYVPELVEDRKDLSNVIALNSTQFNLARLIGPVVAGVAINIIGEGMCFLLNAVSFVAVIIALLLIHEHRERHMVSTQNPWAELLAGARYAWQTLPIRALLGLMTVVSLATGSVQQVFLPVYAKEVYHGTSATLGVLYATVAVGALGAAYLLARRTNVRGLGRWIMIASGITSVSMAAFGFAPSIWLGIPILAALGFGMMKHMGSTNTMLQTVVDDNMRGRVMSFYAMAMVGSMPIGSFLSGFLAAWIGSAETILVFSLTSGIATLWFLRSFPKFREALRPIYERKGVPQVT
jgi:MFS family permease